MRDPTGYGQLSSVGLEWKEWMRLLPIRFAVSPECSQTGFVHNQLGGWSYLNCWSVQTWLIWAWKQEYCLPVL